MEREKESEEEREKKKKKKKEEEEEEERDIKTTRAVPLSRGNVSADDGEKGGRGYETG